MARYPYRFYGWRRNLGQKLIYIAAALGIVAIIIAFLFYPFGKKEHQPDTKPPEVKPDEEIVTKEVEAPKLTAEPNLIETAPGPDAESNMEADRLIAEAVGFINAGPRRIIEARDTLNKVLLMQISEHQRAFVKKQLSELAEKWLFSRTIYPQDRLCGTYRVQPGDILTTIGSQFKVPYEILARINNITRPESLDAGATIKVIYGPFNAKIYRSTRTMDLYLQNTFVRSFAVGLGKPGRETPTGLWVVEPGGKLIKPTWSDPDTGKTYYPEDPDYPLGSRWIRLQGLEGGAVGRTGIAFHGSNDPDLMAGGGSRGCIRLHNGHVQLIYDLMMPAFSHVRVVE